ncbi:MAG: hypothetical protein RL189_971 [Pseudomonadota bacterium]|jgi:mono/diheme cytochrome c family protein
MKNSQVLSVALLFLVSACGRAKKGDVVLPVPLAQGSAKQSKQGGGDASAQTPNPNDAVAVMTLDEAKAKCVACHQPKSSGARVWSTANGTEADWKAVASMLKGSVSADRMPLGAKLPADEKAKFLAYMDQLLGVQPGAGNGGAGGAGGAGGGAGNGGAAGAVPMTLEQAKAKCVACHQPGGIGAAPWSSANGTEADWKAFAQPAKNSVVAGRMPLGGMNEAEKASMIAFLDGLLGVVPGTPVAPGQVKFTFETARVLCVGCHSAAAPANVREQPYLETLAQWKNNKRDISDEVAKASMPQGKVMSVEERQALLDFIGAL